MSFCYKCEEQVELGDIYCPSCGVKLSEISAGKASAGPRANAHKVGTVVCGSELGSYLSNYFSEGDVESIARGINSERKFTVFGDRPSWSRN